MTKVYDCMCICLCIGACLLILICGREAFTSRDGKGDAASLEFGRPSVLYDGKWRLWSVSTGPDAAIKVTAEGMPHVLYLKGGRIDNLPAALGGLPAHENYTAMTRSGARLMVETVPLASAQAAVAERRSHCVESRLYPEETCALEFADF